MKRAVLGLVVLGAVLWGSQGVWADDYVILTGSKIGTAISSLPITITQPGFYFLSKDLTYHGTDSAITISASEVTFDLMGCRLTGPGSNSGKAIAVAGDGVEVRNGVVQGFATGISAAGPGVNNPRLTNLKISGCGTGITEVAENIILTGCEVTGNSWGIQCAGSGVIRRNTASGNSNDGFTLTSFKGVVINNAAYANGVGFRLPGDPQLLVNRNAAYNNTTSDWSGLAGCTTGINTP